VFLLIDLAFQVPRFSDNLTAYSSAVKVAPSNWLLRDYYGWELRAHRRDNDACDQFRIATELAPQLPGIHEAYGEALAHLGRDDEAMTEYTKAFQLSKHSVPFEAIVLSNMADLELKHSEYPEAVAHLRQAVQRAPEVPNYHASLARALNYEGQTEEAEEQMRLEARTRKYTGPVQLASRH
jgi:Flp pilus assembly protein TadD